MGVKMTEDEYINSLQIIYKYLMNAMASNKSSVVYGYISSAMDVVEAIMKRKVN